MTSSGCRGFAAIVLLGACSGEPARRAESPPPVPCAGGGGALAGDRIGTLRLGMSLDSAKILCPTGIDTIEHSEGEATRVLVSATGADTILASFTGSTISSLRTTSPAFLAGDSLRVGMPVGRLLTLPGLAGGYGEGDFYVWSDGEPACGLSFRLDDATARQLLRVRRVTREALRPHAATGRVTAVLARGCRPAPAPPT